MLFSWGWGISAAPQQTQQGWAVLGAACISLLASLSAASEGGEGFCQAAFPLLLLSDLQQHLSCTWLLLSVPASVKPLWEKGCGL